MATTTRAVIVGLLVWLNYASEISAIGWIFPQEPIYREVNDTFRLQCTLNMHSRDARGSNSSFLMFYRAEVPVPSEQVKIINSTTIELTVEHAQPTNDAYTCKLNGTRGIAIRSVFIGHMPQEVKDFKCRAPRWDKHMVCTFTPDANPMPTKYDLVFHFSPIIQNISCPLRFDIQTNQTKCVISADDGYRLINEYYYFVLTATNNLGELSQSFLINHLDVVVPFVPDNCTTDAISSDSVVLKWRKWYKYDGFKRNFISEVKLLSIYDDNAWQIISTDGLRFNGINREYSLPLPHLKYAATRYDVRIRMRTNSSEEGNDLWSNYTSCLFTTLSRKPDIPPGVAIGSFENSNEHHLFVYWRELDKWQHNAGNGFYYDITMLGPDRKIIDRWSTTSGMVDRHRMQDMNYTFIIRSANAEGTSERSSEVFVPSFRHRLAKPVIEKLLSDAGKFTLSWKSTDTSSITSYTVFWCNTTSNSPNDCNGSINFSTVAANQTTFVLNNGGVALNFAVSANSGQLSSGMVWAACTATHKTDIGKLKTIWITETVSSSINLQWKTECGDVVHTGYMIYYCNINEPRMQDCKEPELSINVTNENQHQCLLDNLKSYATYKIEIAMYSETHIGPRSEPVFNTTRESAPSQPRNLTVLNITKNTVTLHWKPPQHINGGTMSYEILYNGFSLKHYLEGPYDGDVEKTLENLDAFTEYSITVRARTVDDSPPSNPVQVRTLLGEPQMIGQPSTNSSSDSQLTIGWKPPIKPSGCVEFYELMIRSKDIFIYQQRKTGCQLREAICQTRDSSKYEFLVRAVNVDIVGRSRNEFGELSCMDRWEELQKHWPALKRYIANEECGTDDAIALRRNGFADSDAPPTDIRLLYGPWSEPLAHWCSIGDKNALLLPAVLAIILFTCFIFFGYSYVRVKHVLQVEVIIPDGLNDLTGSTKPGFSVVNAGGLIFAEHNRDGNIITSCTKDEGYTKEQNQCLLPSSSSSGGSTADLCGHDQRSSPDYCSNSGCCEEDSTSFYDQEAERQDLHGYGDDASDNIDTNHMDDIPSQNCSPPQGEDTAHAFEAVSKVCTTGAPTLLMMAGNHSKPTTVPMSITTGYVPAPVVNPIRQTINSSGYLQLGALTNAGMIAHLNPLQKSFDAKMVAAPISGYVTHKQLSDYGQHLQ